LPMSSDIAALIISFNSDFFILVFFYYKYVMSIIMR
jgi:hypothetical protein